jgi:hypothetical protein
MYDQLCPEMLYRCVGSSLTSWKWWPAGTRRLVYKLCLPLFLSCRIHWFWSSAYREQSRVHSQPIICQCRFTSEHHHSTNSESILRLNPATGGISWCCECLHFICSNMISHQAFNYYQFAPSPIKITINRLLSDSSSIIWSNICPSRVADSEKNLENKLWLLISINSIREYCFDKRMESFCANARARLVLPEPGGPCSRISLQQSVLDFAQRCKYGSLPVETHSFEFDFLIRKAN